MNTKYLDKLEYVKILNILSSFAKTYIGKDMCLNLMPSNNKAEVQKLLNETTEGVNLSFRKGTPPISSFSNIDISIKKLKSYNSLNINELLDVVKILIIARNLKDYFFSDENIDLSEFKILNRYFSSLYNNKNIEENITSKILDSNTIDDRASKNLYRIRNSIRKLEQDIKDKLNSFIHSSTYSKYIQESVITIRNDRFVIPVKEEFRGQIKGFIHDMSSSGSTVFIEPMTIFELNNEINSLKIEENLEIEKILDTLSSILFPIVEDLENNTRLIGRLDFIFSKAAYSRDINAIEPILNDKKYVNLIKARHPLIDKDIVVPIDINIGEKFSCLVITGPNTGGKTVTLKTVGLLCLMASSGLHIPANSKSSIYVFDNIFADIGDEQSIQESLSTFSSHILNIIEILNESTPNSLVLIDELGSGTDPIEGSSLAISILETFFDKGSLIITTTHYPEIKNYALITYGFENASSEFDVENLKPTYKLLLGIPGKSNAFAISKKLGLSNKILDRSKSLVNSENISIEDVLKGIYDDKIIIEKEKLAIEENSKEIENLKRALQRDNTELLKQEKEIISNAKIEARKILLDAKEEADLTIKEINSIYNNINDSSLKNLNNIRNKLNNSIKEKSILENNSTNSNNIATDDIKIDMTVYIDSLNQYGIIKSLPNKSDQVRVQIGSATINIDVNKLSKSNKDLSKENKIITNNTKSSTLKSKNISQEINVIGLNVEEALVIIDKYLDDVSLAKLNNIRIVHGKGTGKLRQGIHTFLKKHPHVKSFRLGTFGEGEMGVTIVEIK